MSTPNKLLHKTKRIACTIAAVIFLLEAWLWDHLKPLVGTAVSWFPWDELKLWVAKKIVDLPAWACVFLFIIPAIAIFPIKVIGVWLISKHHVFFGITVFLLAKLVGLGIAAFIFETCKEKLLNLAWFLWLYETLKKIKLWAKKQVEPAKREILKFQKMLLGNNRSMLFLLKKIRRNIIYRARKL